MRKLSLIASVISLLITQSSFADSNTAMKSNAMGDDTIKPCEVIAKACKKGGYSRESGKGKLFWKNCMKPIVLGNAVSGVSVNASDVKACREFKIEKMETELAELKEVK